MNNNFLHSNTSGKGCSTGWGGLSTLVYSKFRILKQAPEMTLSRSGLFLLLAFFVAHMHVLGHEATCLDGEPKYYRVTYQPEAEDALHIQAAHNPIEVVQTNTEQATAIIKTKHTAQELKQELPGILSIEMLPADQWENQLFDHRTKSQPDFLRLFFNFL